MFDKLDDWVSDGGFLRFAVFMVCVVTPILAVPIISGLYLIHLFGLYFIIPVWLVGLAYLAYVWMFK